MNFGRDFGPYFDDCYHHPWGTGEDVFIESLPFWNNCFPADFPANYAANYSAYLARYLTNYSANYLENNYPVIYDPNQAWGEREPTDTGDEICRQIRHILTEYQNRQSNWRCDADLPSLAAPPLLSPRVAEEIDRLKDVYTISPKKYQYKPKVAGMSDNELIPCWYSSVRERRRKAEEEKRELLRALAKEKEKNRKLRGVVIAETSDVAVGEETKSPPRRSTTPARKRSWEGAAARAEEEDNRSWEGAAARKKAESKAEAARQRSDHGLHAVRPRSVTDRNNMPTSKLNNADSTEVVNNIERKPSAWSVAPQGVVAAERKSKPEKPTKKTVSKAANDISKSISKRPTQQVDIRGKPNA